MQEQAPRIPTTAVAVDLPVAVAVTLAVTVALAAGAAARAAEIRFADATLTVSETTSAVSVQLELDVPECAGEVRVGESVVTVSSTAGGFNPATPGDDFALVDVAVPVGVTGVPPIRFGRVLQGVVIDDARFDGFDPETFTFEVTPRAGATVDCLADGSSLPLAAGTPLTVSIEDDEEPPEVAFARGNDSVAEDRGAKRYTLIRSNGSSGAVTATLFTSSDRIAVEPAAIVWADGESGERELTVFFEDDDEAQGNVRVTVSFELDGAIAIEPDELVIRIVDDDEEVAPEPSVLAFNRAAATIPESRQEATFALRRTGRDGAVRAALRVDYAGAELDPSTVSWGDGESGVRRFTVRFADDNRPEEDMVATVTFAVTAGDATPGDPDELVITIRDDDDAASVTGTGGDNQVGLVGSDLPLPLQVLVTNRAGGGVEGATVTWTVAEGDATLVDGMTTVTDAQGRTSNRVRLGATPGTVRVQAAAAGTGLVARFIVNVLADDPVAGALLRACGDDDDNLNGVCGYFRALDDVTEQQAVIDEIRPEEVASQANTTQDAPRVQLGNVGARLAALRRSGTGSSFQQLALNVGGLHLNPHVLTAAMRRRPTVEADPVEALDRAFAKAAYTLADAQQQDDPPPSTDSSLDDAPGRLGFYVNGSASFGDRSSTALESGFEFETLGLTAGLDYRLKPGLFLGGALGYLSADTDLDRDGGELDSEGQSLSFYVMRYWDSGLYVQGVVGYGRNDHDLVRNIDLRTPFRGKTRYAARGETDGTQTSFALELGYDGSRGALSIGGFGRASYVESDIDRYRETGDPDGSGFYLEVFDQSAESLLGEGGVSLSYAASFSWGVLLPQGRLSYLHEFEDDSRDVRARFIEDTDPSNVFAIPTEEPDRDYFNVGVGLGAQFQRGVSAFLFYDTDLERDDLDVSTFTAGLRFEF